MNQYFVLYCFSTLLYFEEFETERSQRPIGKCYRIDMFEFHLYETSKLTRFIDFHPTHNTIRFSFNIFLCNVCFRDERELISVQNTNKNYILELDNRDILPYVQTMQKIYRNTHKGTLLRHKNKLNFLSNCYMTIHFSIRCSFQPIALGY